MEKQKITLDRSIMAAIEAIREVLQTTVFEGKKLRLAEVDIFAEQSRPGEAGDGYDEHRTINISVGVQHDPFTSNWASFFAECEVSLPTGPHDFWNPRIVILSWTGSQWNRTAIFHPNGVLEIKADNGIRIFE